MKTYALLFLLLLELAFAPHGVYTISPRASAATMPIAVSVRLPQPSSTLGAYADGFHFTQAQIDQFLIGTKNPTILRQLIKCESQNTNVARMDSNHLISYGILQFNGTATWDGFAALANATGSTPMNPVSAIKVADWMVSHNQLARWSCARILKLLP